MRDARSLVPSKGQIKNFVDKKVKSLKFDYLSAIAINQVEENSKFDVLDLDNIEEELRSKKNWS